VERVLTDSGHRSDERRVGRGFEPLDEAFLGRRIG